MSALSDITNLEDFQFVSDPASKKRILEGPGTPSDVSKRSRLSFYTKNLELLEIQSQIIPGLLIGSYLAAKNKRLLNQNKVTHVLSLDSQESTLNFQDRVHLRVPLQDTEDENLLAVVPSCIEFIRSALSVDGNVVFVHCQDGVSRSAAIAMAYLITVNRMSYDSALKTVKERRNVCQPNDGFVLQLKFLASSFYKICTAGVVEQYQYWIDSQKQQVSPTTPQEKPKRSSSVDVEKVLDKEKQKHKKTKKELDKVKKEAQKGKQTLHGLTKQISEFLSASEAERQKLVRELENKEGEYSRALIDLEAENKSLKEELTKYKKQMVDDLTTLMDECNRIEEYNQDLRSELEERNRRIHSLTNMVAERDELISLLKRR